MEMVIVMKIGIIVLGTVMILAGFWFHSMKKLTVNFAVSWAGLGLLLIVLTAFVPMAVWSRMFSAWQGIPLLCMSLIVFAGGFLFSILISQLTMKNRELAMQVSLLIEEKEQMELKLEEALGQHEKAAVGY